MAYDEEAVLARVAEIVHVARKHEDGDSNEPCLIEMPSGRSWCGGPEHEDHEIANALADANLVNWEG